MRESLKAVAVWIDADFFRRSKTFFAREAIEQHLEDLEDYYLGLEAMKNAGRLYTPDEAKRELGL